VSIIKDFRQNALVHKRKQTIEVGRKNFRHYCNLINPEFYKAEYAYQDVLCNTIQSAYEKRLVNPGTGKPYDILIINLPPGFGKSYTGVLFSTWAYGQKAKNQIVEVSYNSTLAEGFSKSVREAIRDEEIPDDPKHYVVNSFFPRLKIKHGDGAVTRWALEGSYMSYLATGFDGSLTGMRGHIGIIDDPIKNDKEAVNENVKEAHFSFYKNTFTSRMLDGALQIIIQTRWATDDLAGRLLAEYPDRCYELRMPALTAEGKSLCEGLYSTEDLLQKKATLDSHIWLANYMQEPIDITGGLYASGFKTFDAVDPDQFERVLAYTDTADQGADNLCQISAGIIDKYAYVLDVYFTSDAMETTEPEAARRLHQHGIREAAIESNNGGRGFARNVERELRQLKNHKCQVTWFTQTKNKRTRILVNASNALEQIIFPEDWKKRWPEFAEALARYQRKGKNAHDDAPDALTGLVELINGDVKLKRKARVGSRRRLGL